MIKQIPCCIAVFVILISIFLKGDDMDSTESPQIPESEFGITRTEWTEDASPRDRIDLAQAVRDIGVKLEGTEKAIVETNKGNFWIKLYAEDAPNTVSNFIRLAESGFYDGLTWHRYVEGSVIQGGDPTGTGRGDPGYTIDFEENERIHVTGAVGMARKPDINSASCQFYIALNPLPQLDGKYCVFGIVTEGMDAVRQLRAADTIIRIEVER